MNFISGEIVQAPQGTDAICVRTQFNDKVLCQTGGVNQAATGKEVHVSIRPEDVEVFTDPPQDRENLFKGTIAHKAYLGNFLYFFVNVNGTEIQAQVQHNLPQDEGQEVYLFLDPQKCIILF
jgi:ABC-type Fe3+/spermidine/putrescine transport system ATPase subunit